MALSYRLYRRDAIQRGHWYYGFECGGCQRPIYALDDPTNGGAGVNMVGDGTFAVPCLSCAYDGTYSLAQMKRFQAENDALGGRPERVKPDKSSRKPLWKAYPKAKAIIGVGYIEDRPKAAAIVARIITAWADVEGRCAGLLGELMDTHLPSAAAVFGSLRSSRAQSDALQAAADIVLNDEDNELFSAHMARRAGLEKERNDLAHGHFGVSVAIPDYVVWISQADHLAFQARTDANAVEAYEKFRRSQYVYTLGTLERIAQEIEEFYNQIGFFTGYLSARRDGAQGSTFRTERYPQLCNQSHIREALGRIRTAKAGRQSREI